MKVWVVKTSEMLATDNRNGRLMRSGLLAHMLDARGHTVTWWISTFDHANRRQRALQDTVGSFGSRGAIRMLLSPGYRRSVSLARLRDHRIWASRFRKAARAAERPDLILCAYPTIESAWECVRFGQRSGIPVVLDLRDMWPDIFLEELPRALRASARTLIWPIRATARAALSHATALFAITDEFLAWGLGIAGRPRRELDAVFAQAYPSSHRNEDSAAREAAGEFWDGRGITRAKSFNVVLIGTITGRRIKMETILAAAKQMSRDSKPVQIVIAGDGDDLPRYRDSARECPNVLFSGWLGVAQIRELLTRSHLGLIPYRNTPDYVMAIPTKAAEYFASGVPVATCLRGALPKLLEEQQCGLEFEGSNPESLVSVIRSLRDDPARWSKLSSNARRLFEQEFVAEEVYARYIDHLEQIASVASASVGSRPTVRESPRGSARDPSSDLR